jgi:3'-phosphoadenosine 5'-phosphosulfate sulfotransferase (PAPS reductase)/FAD synthetase
MNHIIFFSGGKASLATADYVKNTYPDDNILLYNTDTLWENEDLYRFINEPSDKLHYHY